MGELRLELVEACDPNGPSSGGTSQETIFGETIDRGIRAGHGRPRIILTRDRRKRIYARGLHRSEDIGGPTSQLARETRQLHCGELTQPRHDDTLRASSN